MLRNLAIALFLTAPILFAQGAEKKAADTQPEAGRIRDDRVSVENLSFWKKNSADGKGDYLEFTFDVVNKTEDNIPLKMFILAFNEKDLIDAQYRKYVEYPHWRKLDEDKLKHKIVLFTSIPETKHDEVAAFARDREQKAADIGKYTLPKEQPTPAGSKKKTTLQDFLRYVEYIHEKPDTGLDLKLQGFENADHQIKCDGGRTTAKDCLDKRGNYLIEEKALKTNVWGKLLSRYRVDRKFFNHLGVILYDTDAKKIVHRQFYSINGHFKVY